MPSNNLANHPTVVAFASSARTFIDLLDGAPASGDGIVVDLFRCARRLLETAPELPDAAPSPRALDRVVDDMAWRRVYEFVGTLPLEPYYEWRWPDGDITTADIADDFADVYRDLKPGLVAFDSGREELISDAVWDWVTFKSHWQAHLVGLHGQLLPHVRRPGWQGVSLAAGEAAFLAELLDRHPDWSRHVSRLPSEEPETWTVALEVPSPTADAERGLALWFEGTAPTVGFGTDWHMHASSMQELWDTVDAILSDTLVLAADMGGKHDGFEDVLDLRDEDAVVERLTDIDSPRGLRIRSFAGTQDRELP